MTYQIIFCFKVLRQSYFLPYLPVEFKKKIVSIDKYPRELHKLMFLRLTC